MNKIIFVFLSLLINTSVFSQYALTDKNNLPRVGDEIIKQQVKYKDIGRKGENVIWNFSQQQAVNSEYKLSYHAPKLTKEDTYILGLDTFPAGEVNPEDLIIGYEHYTHYYYQVQDNRLLLLGHGNSVSQMHHEKPLPIAQFPFNYGDSINDNYHSLTLYAGAKPMKSEGDISVAADAYGMMILPNQDTLRNVMRVKTIRTIVEIPDTATTTKRRPKSVPVNTRVENYLWYAKGYRYPIFETIRNIDTNDSIHSEYFATAFFYPPVEHYYLENDAENSAVLDSLATEELYKNDPQQWLRDNFTCNFNPNPVSHLLNVEYHLEEGAEVGVTLYSSTTGWSRQIPVGMKQRGYYTETFDCSGLPIGIYILRFNVRGLIVSNIIIKN
jgi:hypothetical protein